MEVHLTSCWKDVINANLPKPAEIFCYPNKDLLEREHIKRALKKSQKLNRKFAKDLI